MIVYVHPVLLAHRLVDDERAIVILMRVVLDLRDIVLGECLVRHVGELADGNVPDCAVVLLLAIRGRGPGPCGLPRLLVGIRRLVRHVVPHGLIGPHVWRNL